MTGTLRSSRAGRPLVVVAVLLLVVAIGVLWIRRDPRQLLLVPNGVMLVAADTRAPFFQDSSFLLQLNGDGGDAYPIRIAVWFDERAPLNSEAVIMRGIESFAERVAGARLTRIAGGVFHPLLAMPEAKAWADITVDLWALGGYRSDVTLYCAQDRGGGGVTREPVHLASNRGRVAPGSGLDVLGELVDIARRARCPGEPRLVQQVSRLTLGVDTLRLRVGESVNPEQALRLLALRADGSVIERFVPFYSIANMSVAAMGALGLRGIAAGVTSASVRAMSRDAMQGVAEGVSASFVIEVVP